MLSHDHQRPRRGQDARQSHSLSRQTLNRRNFLAICSSFGLAGTLFPGALWTLAQETGKITPEMIEQAAVIADVPIPPEDREMMLAGLTNQAKGYEEIYRLHIGNSVQPAFVFDPVPEAMHLETIKRPARISAAVVGVRVPRNLEEIAFATVRELAETLRARKVSSTALTQMYLERLKRYDPQLHFVITLTEERALAQAKEADLDIAAGKYRGPLHGLPWGAKDLLAVKGYKTTWGAAPYEDQVLEEDATVVKRLDAAGAVLVAKLTLGALAMGDQWFGGLTRNPWNPAQGSSGSSAGPASATAAGCVAFSIGSETQGSIAAPSTRCGCTGLRPTFGLVPRTGAMALSWTMDKLGPICRAVEDCALVLSAIYGPDGQDRSVRRAAFNWDADLDWRKLRVGYLESEFQFDAEALTTRLRSSRRITDAELEAAVAGARYDQRFDVAALAKLREMGVRMTAVEIPKYPYDALRSILSAEAAAAFDELTRSGRDKLMERSSWPNSFRMGRFIPAVEYIQANRLRFMVIETLGKAFEGFDVIIAPTSGQQQSVTNFSGHPALIVPNGFRGDDAPPTRTNVEGPSGNYSGPGTPVSITFLGQLYGEAKLLAFGRAYQNGTKFHLQHPKL
jgi:Asp-tRNA(Asn)/Glu-tRNA(Gln) amidotransferase A subunit family amidase